MKEPMFVDSHGTQWKPRITCNTIRKFEDQTGVSLIGQDEAAIKASFSAKFGNMLCLAYLACEAQAVKSEISFNEFCERFETAEVLPGMTEATVGALVLFTQPRSKES